MNGTYVAVLSSEITGCIIRYIIFRSPGKPDLDKYFKWGLM